MFIVVAAGKIKIIIADCGKQARRAIGRTSDHVLTRFINIPRQEIDGILRAYLPGLLEWNEALNKRMTELMTVLDQITTMNLYTFTLA